MGDLRVDEWLPVGWNVEVKIGKNGKKETYYVDPVNGYMFRSIKDIDRYLLTGELGRNVVKPKEQTVGCSNTKLDIVSSPSKQHASKKKKEVLNGSNNWEKPGRSPKKKPVANSRKTTKPWKSLRSSNDDIDSVPFFKGDSAPGQGERASTSYFSASAFGSLLGTQVSGYEAKHDEAMIPGWVPGADPNGEFQSLLLEAAGPEPFFPECTWLDNEYTTEAELFGTVDDFHTSDMLLGSKDSESLFSVLSAVDERNRMAGMETRTVEDPGSPHAFLFGIYSDPCIDFAVKTLTSTLDPASGDYLQRQLGSSSASGNDLNGSGVQAEGLELTVTQGTLSGL